MANYSYVDIELTGSEKDIKNVLLELESKKYNDNWLLPYQGLDDFLEDGYNTMYEVEITSNDTSIYITGEGKWSGPYEYIKDLVERHNLSGSMFDMESGMDWCYLIEFENGEITRDEEDAYFSDLSIQVKGIDFWIEELSWVIDMEDWEEDYDHYISIFDSNGVSVENLKENWN